MGEAATVISGAGTAFSAMDLARKGLSFFQRSRLGVPRIDNRRHNDNVHEEWVPLEGSYLPGMRLLRSAETPIFWIVTRERRKHWAQFALNIRSDNRWDGRMNINHQPGPRRITVLLVWASPFMNDIFEDYKRRGDRTRDWGAIEMTPPKRELKIVQAIELQVPAGVTPVKPQSG